ncbi:MAG: hypothetical protein Q8K70_03335 [Bacteroidota bacterium]|nr:hypothetical protein [Bacteroidota bacterium]
MCKIKIYSLLLLFISINGYAQIDGEIETPLQQQNVDTEENTKTKLGIKFTMGGHTFRGDAFDNEKPKYGFGIGIYNIVHLNKKKTQNFHWEFNFTFKGSKFATPNDTSFSRISLSYIELPVYYSIALNPKNKKPIHLLTGMQFSYMFRNSINKSYGKWGTVKSDLPFLRHDFAPAIGIRKELGSGISLQFTGKLGLVNIYTNTFKERTDNPDPDEQNYDYSDIYPRFKDGTHKAKNVSFELSLFF